MEFVLEGPLRVRAVFLIMTIAMLSATLARGASIPGEINHIFSK
jgi:hypothetical protein